MEAFRQLDFLNLDDQLSEDERMVWESARAYAREKLLPRVVAAFRDVETGEIKQPALS